MALFIDGIILFLILAIGFGAVFLGIVRSMAGKEFRISRRAFAYGLAIPLVVGLVFLGIGAFLEYHEAPEFCGEMCHSMEPYYVAYSEPENNSMMITHKEEGVACTGCHVGPGWWGQVEAYWSVPHEIWSEMFDTYDPDDLHAVVKEESCTKCHDGGEAMKPGKVMSVTGELVDPHSEDRKCADCHPSHTAGWGVSLDTCEFCHGHALADWETSMEAHGNRTGGECLDCHDRDHPEDARVPWDVVGDILDMQFCTDCHPAETTAYLESSTEASLELYGECLDCHTEHLSSEAFHSHEAPYDQCTDCHPNYEGSVTVHNRTGVSYLGLPDVGNDLCDICHAEQIEGLDLNKQHRGLDCVYCHGDHMGTIVTFDECTVCHRENLPSSHDEDISRCTRSSCHGTGWYH